MIRHGRGLAGTDWIVGGSQSAPAIKSRTCRHRGIHGSHGLLLRTAGTATARLAAPRPRDDLPRRFRGPPALHTSTAKRTVADARPHSRGHGEGLQPDNP